nr:MAG TPA: hypothetical protein [Caudoviricetes sp.]
MMNKIERIRVESRERVEAVIPELRELAENSIADTFVKTTCRRISVYVSELTTNCKHDLTYREVEENIDLVADALRAIGYAVSIEIMDTDDHDSYLVVSV